jgi:hypothetical protein
MASDQYHQKEKATGKRSTKIGFEMLGSIWEESHLVSSFRQEWLNFPRAEGGFHSSL